LNLKTDVLRLVFTCVLATSLPAAEPARIESFTAVVKLEKKVTMPVDVYLPANKERAPLVLVAHGFTQNKDYHANQGRKLAGEGYVVLIPSLQRFGNHAGHGQDLRSLLDWAEGQNLDKTSQLFGRVDASGAAAAGHSAGGLSALLAAAADDRIRVLVLMDAVDWKGIGAKAGANLKIPKLSICAEPSPWNDHGSPEKLAAALPEPKKTLKIAGANHLEAQDPVNKLGLSIPGLGKVNPERQRQFTDQMASWIKTHLPSR
jgi:dienelactone hydrolase